MTVEAINPLTLPSLKLQERRSLPECAAVYFVLNSSDDILYIGGTVNLAQRWLAHHRWYQLVEMGDGIRLAWLECSEPALLLEIEAALINHFQPTLNRTPVPVSALSAKSPNLSVIISQEDKEKLKRLAIAEKRSVSQLAAIAIQEYLDKVEANQNKGAA